jgi:hypothetical protein
VLRDPNLLGQEPTHVGSKPLTKAESARLNRRAGRAGGEQGRDTCVVRFHNDADIAALFRDVDAVYEVLTMMGKDCRWISAIPASLTHESRRLFKLIVATTRISTGNGEQHGFKGRTQAE